MMKATRKRSLGAAAALLLAFAGWVAPARAVDGVVEISHACAQLGCFAGDVIGYPVTIDGSVGHSYRLTSDLIVPNPDTHGVLVWSTGITLDLNGFQIVRAGCETATTSCRPTSGSGTGIRGSATLELGTAVYNGTIVGMGEHGIELSDHALVSDVQVIWNRLDGLRVGEGSIVTRVRAKENGQDGVVAAAGSLVHAGHSSENLRHGVSAGNGTSVQQIVAWMNEGAGLVVGHGAVVAGNVSGENSGNGIEGGDGVVVRENESRNNGGAGIQVARGAVVAVNTARSSALYGIVAGEGSALSTNRVGENLGGGLQAGAGSLVEDNLAEANGNNGVHVGLSLDATAGYRRNVVFGNAGGTVTGGIDLQANSCEGTASCP